MIAWLETMTGLESRFLVTRTRVTLRKMVARLESRFSQNDSTRFESQLMSRFIYTQKMSVFASAMIKIGANFLFWLFSRAMLHLGIKCLQLAQRKAWDFAFHWGACRAQYIDTSSQFNAGFVYRDHGRWQWSHTDTVTWSLFQIPVK